MHLLDGVGGKKSDQLRRLHPDVDVVAVAAAKVTEFQTLGITYKYSLVDVDIAIKNNIVEYHSSRSFLSNLIESKLSLGRHEKIPELR